jgi:hypothetical protein
MPRIYFYIANLNRQVDNILTIKDAKPGVDAVVVVQPMISPPAPHQLWYMDDISNSPIVSVMNGGLLTRQTEKQDNVYPVLITTNMDIPGQKWS